MNTFSVIAVVLLSRLISMSCPFLLSQIHGLGCIWQLLILAVNLLFTRFSLKLLCSKTNDWGGVVLNVNYLVPSEVIFITGYILVLKTEVKFQS